jgi:prepilin-type N-terminal cleavage/methylation domain-containing protein
MITKSQFRSLRGFTFIELMVVIAVVAILASTVFVGYHRIVRSARAVDSLSQLRQIGVGFSLYVGEHNHFFPPAWNAEEGRTYAQYLDPYIYDGSEERKKENIFISPCAQAPVVVERWSHPITYSANPAICIDESADENGFPRQRPVPLWQIKRQIETILLIDGCQVTGNNGQARASFYAVEEVWQSPDGMDNLIDVGPDTDIDSSAGHIRYPANEMAQALMVDGSALRFRKGTITKANVNIGRR